MYGVSPIDRYWEAELRGLGPGSPHSHHLGDLHYLVTLVGKVVLPGGGGRSQVRGEVTPEV